MNRMISKGKDSNTSIYEAIGKMLLDNTALGRMMAPSYKAGDDQKYDELLEKPLWQLSGKDHEYMLKRVIMDIFSSFEGKPTCQKHYVQGYSGIATLFRCSKSTAQRIKKSGVIDDAITQVNRKILVDADMALQLVKKNGYKIHE
ncbi:MAG: DUF3853 family protein [Prevotella sp.]